MKGGTGLGAGLWALSGAALIPGIRQACAAEWRAFTQAQAPTLIRFLRDLFPHDHLNDAFYAAALAPLDAQCARNAGTKARISSGLEDLDARARRAAGRPFAAVPNEAVRIRIMRDIEDSAFFKMVYSTCQVALYNQPDLWPNFGFEGPSSPYGGYIDRGFDDLDWL